MGLEVREVGPIQTPRHRNKVYLPATTVPPFWPTSQQARYHSIGPTAPCLK